MYEEIVKLSGHLGVDEVSGKVEEDEAARNLEMKSISGRGVRSIRQSDSVGEAAASNQERLPASVVEAGLPAQIEDDEEEDEILPPPRKKHNPSPSVDPIDDDDIEKSVPFSSLAWEAYELSSDWSKSLKGDHGILAALDLSLPLPMCNVDISSPSKPRDILDIFGDVMDLPPLNNFMDKDTGDRFAATSSVDDQTENIAVNSSLRDVSIGSGSATSELDKSNMLMTPQELERMPDQGLEFEQSVGPKELPKLLPAPPKANTPGEEIVEVHELTDDQVASLTSTDTPVVLSQKGRELTTITVLTSFGEKTFKVNTEQLQQAATSMQPVIINSGGESNFTLVMMPVSKTNMVEPTTQETKPEAKYKCLQCDMTFMRSYKLRLHEMMKHMLEKPFKCTYPDCKWAFSNAYRQKNHERSHLKLKTEMCALCGKHYSSIWNLRSHIAQQHDDDKNMFECDVCLKRFTAETKLYKHISAEHPEHPKQFKCEEEGCEAEYHSKLGLMRHIVGHKKRKELNLVCPFGGCGRSFDWKSRYDQHVRAHKGENNYKCTFQGCTAAFISMSILNRHKKTHSQEKSLKCSECSKTFHRLDHLKTHEKSHVLEKEFFCTEPGCKHACATKRGLETHIKRHAVKAMRAVLICPDKHCGLTFFTKQQLIKHVNAHHPYIAEMQYARELAELHPDLQPEHLAERTETMIATSSVAEPETDNSALNWRMELVQNAAREEPMAVVNTEVAGKRVELILPTDMIAMGEQATTGLTLPEPIRLPRSEKGSARTDLLVNEKMRCKARARQEREKEQAVPMLPNATGRVSVEAASSITDGRFSADDSSGVPADLLVSSGGGMAQSIPVTATLATSLIESSTSGPAISVTAMPTGLWYTSVNQDGGDAERTLMSTSDIYTPTSSGVLEHLTGTIDENVEFIELYEGLE